MEKKTVLAIDDEEHILELLTYNLEASGFVVYTATTVKQGKEILEKQNIDTILLDIMLSDMDGVTALRQFKTDEKTKWIPVIMVTAKSEEIDKIIGLELGADDYISKPFSVRELVARVKVVMRRNTIAEANVSTKDTNKLRYKELEVDIESHTVSYDQHVIELTLKEFEILRLLMENRGKVLTREVLLDKIWGYDYYGETRTVDVHIRYLRSKLDGYGLEDCIETVRGVGYKFIKE
ncbi:MAG: response regulator transcription factor [Cellulosilyticaceae bacterium]